MTELSRLLQVKDGIFWNPIRASYGQVDAIKTLKEMGADISAKEEDEGTPMHWAAENGHVGAIMALKEAGADVLAKDADGWTPMHRAARNEHVGAIKALKEAEIDQLKRKHIWKPRSWFK